jgi:hypothetical protein
LQTWSLRQSKKIKLKYVSVHTKRAGSAQRFPEFILLNSRAPGKILR